MTFSTAAEFDQAYKSANRAFAAGTTKNKEWRRRQLKRAWWMIEDNKKRICDALYTDLHKHYQEAYTGDCGTVQADALRTIAKLDEWTKDIKPERSDPLNFLGGATIRKEPLGVTLIIGAWNFPITLLLQPMLAAIAAGCAMILKPSDVASATQDVLMDIIPKYMDRDAIRCVSAGAQEMSYILEHRFDHIFYTGSPNVAKIIHAAAAKHLTPVTLELGGQCPAIVAESANLDLTAKHIAVTKFMNAGQICLNVNHVLVAPGLRDRLVAELIKYFDTFAGGKAQNPDYYTHIINERNFDRLDTLLKQTSGKIVYGGERNRETRYFAPTIVTGVKAGDSLLSEELFGPILPIIDADFDTAISTTRAGEHPLAIYAFTSKAADKSRILNETQSGGVTFNDCGLHIAARDVPFGGVGNSGTGYYHGPYGILTFSHLRTYINALPWWMEGVITARYPPYSVEKAHKMVPAAKPTFDREGNDLTSSRSKWVLSIGGLALSALLATRWDQVIALGSQLLN
ncbi:Aldehyde dehydrogenase C-terminal [Penicillium bovifimosum]|uniref:Aldehyde dehydrogenase n=1 Tax=Penicillium bovifimosum TaxID=126998 RepID=A0A9W9HBG4_9EURO|nr:Aldehyde dehydrogenase C-terminal [Penicillium bovifimosum]KAJ5143544.1 Aldehyde dehydrogenase C-terminal [Penicillium bovifimosum]